MFEGIVKLSEETRDPKKTIPRALLLSVVITSVLYILTAFAALAILGPQELGASSAPLADVAAKALHTSSSQAFLAIAIIALFSTANTVLLLLVTTSRLLYGMAENHVLPLFFASVDKQRRTPYVSILATSVFTIIFILLGNLEFAARLTDFAVFLVFILVNLGVIALRINKPGLPRPFKTPLSIKNIPISAVLGIITCIGLAYSIP